MSTTRNLQPVVDQLAETINRGDRVVVLSGPTSSCRGTVRWVGDEEQVGVDLDDDRGGWRYSLSEIALLDAVSRIGELL